MSKEVDRAQVLKTTKVRTALKTDGSWIHKSKQGNDRTQSDAEAGPVPAKNKSFVSSAAKKFERKSSVILTYINTDLAQRLHHNNLEYDVS